jgi:hypothetical protein
MVSAAQLATGLVGMAVAVRRRHQYDFLFLHGHPDHVARDTVLMGTAFSAPATMLVAQAVAAARLWRAPSRPAHLVVAGLGLAMVPGYLGEKLVRRRLTRSGYDRLETPLVIAAIQLAALMALLGLSSLRPRPELDSAERVLVGSDARLIRGPRIWFADAPRPG